MNFLVWFLFAILWMVLGFFALRFILQRVLKDERAATITSLLVVVAYTAGFYTPLGSHAQQDASATAAAPSQAPAVTAAQQPVVPSVIAGSDISSNCAHASSVGSAKTLGYADSFRKSTGPIKTNDSVLSSDQMEIAGWAGSAGGTALAKAVCLVLDNKIDTRAQVIYGISRPDVATALKIPAFDRTGFVVHIKPHTLPKGEHRIEIVAISADGSSGVLSGEWTIRIR